MCLFKNKYSALHSICRNFLFLLTFFPGITFAENFFESIHNGSFQLQSISVRTRFSEETILGREAPEEFEAYDFSASFLLPWEDYSLSEWGVGTRLMTSAGLLRGVGKNALVVSAIPKITVGSEDQRFTFDAGAGGALFSRYRFGDQDYGGAFQFALTLGASAPLYKQINIGYRFLHYSDAALYGASSIGADFHMIELSFRL